MGGGQGINGVEGREVKSLVTTALQLDVLVGKRDLGLVCNEPGLTWGTS